MRSVPSSLGWLALYVGAVWLGRETAVAGTGLALFWPAAGVAALWILRSGPGQALTIDLLLLFTGTLLANQLTGVEEVPAVLFGLANVVVAVAVRETVHRSSIGAGTPGRLPGLAATSGVLTLGRAAVLAGLASAPIGALAGYLLTDRWSALGVLAWTVRNTTGTFVVTCAVLTLVAARRARRPGAPWYCCLTQEQRPGALWEVAVGLAASAASLALVFGNDQHLPLAFVPLTVSAFVGFRFAPVVAAAQSLAFAAAAILATLAGWGPFGALDDPVVAAILVQAFVLATSVISITLSFAVADRHALIEQLREAEATSDERAQLLEAVTRSLPHGLAVVDADGTILVKNPAATALAGGPEESVDLGAGLERYGITRVDGSPLGGDAPHVRALAGRESAAMDVRVTDPATGSTRLLSVEAEPLELTGATTRRVAVVTLHDVTEQRARVSQLKSFAGVVAHDLRNPLAAVSGWTSVLAKHLEATSTPDERTRSTLARIRRSGQTMTDLIEDLLAYATASDAPLSPAAVDLDALVSSIASELRAGTTSAPIVTCDPLGTVTADPTLVRQLLANVLGNAVKYVAEGTRPVVAVTADRTADEITIRVSDNGIGIPPEDRSRVFDGFTRLGGSAYSGTGLGLAICARAVERHGGRVSAGDGPDGTGTTVSITLPVAQPTPGAGPDTRSDTGAELRG